MKTFIKNFLKTLTIASLFLSGVAFANAASFDTNPSDNTGTVSIWEGEGDNKSGIKNSISINLSEGEHTYVTVFTDFMAKRGNNTGIIDPGYVSYDVENTTGTSSSFNFYTTLKSSDTSDHTDSAKVTGLPDSYKIEYISGHVENEHGGSNTSANGTTYTCPTKYDYNVDVTESDIFSNSGEYLGTLTNEQEGWCSQGTVAVKYKITNTEEDESVDSFQWSPNDNTSGWSGWGDCINNIETQTRTVVCQDQNGINVNTSNCTGPMPLTTQTRTCGSSDNTLTVDTDAPDVGNNNNVILNGEVQSGSSNHQWFVIGDGQNISCSAPYYGSDSLSSNPNYSAQNGGTLDAGGDFDIEISYLPEGDYWYVACAGLDTDPASGIIRPFSIDEDDISNGSDPDAETKDEDDVDENSAELNGKIRMNDFDNGNVFYVYGEDQSDVEDAADEDEYDDIEEDGDNIQTEIVDSNNDEEGWESYNLDINGLDNDTLYYFMICVEYDDENGDETLECGGVEKFRTDDDGDNNDDSDIETRTPDSISETSAKICGDLNDDGGDSNLRTWMEFRKSSSSSYTRSDKVDRGEGYYCVTVRNLSPDTRYTYRACSDDGCASTQTFTTDGDNDPSGEEPLVTTDNVYNVRSSSAVLPGTYVTNATSGTVWFQYGRSETLNKETRRYTKYGSGGGYVHNFTGLAANQRYCYRAMIHTLNGTDYGATKCFVTQPYTPGPEPVEPEPPVIVVVEEDDDVDIDLSRLGLGLSLIRLEIDDDRETVTKGENITYEIRWENISEIDLDDLDLNITIPREVQITSSSRGKLDQDRNAIFYTIDDLEAGEDNSMTVTGIVNNGTLGDALTADATIAFDNPINDAQENATDYDVDEYVVPIVGVGTASVFGLANITFLGWLTILLGLFIVFLVARWLYLEREELRAQAYVNGYGRTPYMAPVDNRYDYIEAPRAPVREARYVEPVAPAAPQYVAPVVPQANPVAPQAGERPDYRPYRPNR